MKKLMFVALLFVVGCSKREKLKEETAFILECTDVIDTGAISRIINNQSPVLYLHVNKKGEMSVEEYNGIMWSPSENCDSYKIRIGIVEGIKVKSEQTHWRFK